MKRLNMIKAILWDRDDPRLDDIWARGDHLSAEERL